MNLVRERNTRGIDEEGGIFLDVGKSNLFLMNQESLLSILIYASSRYFQISVTSSREPNNISWSTDIKADQLIRKMQENL